MEEAEKYFKDRIHTIGKILEKDGHKFGEKDIHKLRVEIKRLRALFSLAEFTLSGFNGKDSLAVLKDIFKIAGELREAQLETACLKRLEISTSMPHYMKSLEKGMDRARSHFKKAADSKLMQAIDLLIIKVEPKLESIERAEVDAFLQDRSTAVTRLMQEEDLGNAALHEYRKQLKEFHYMSELGHDSPYSSETIYKLQECLGNWHDCDVLIRKFRKILDGDEVDEGERIHLEFAIRNLERENASVLRQLEEIRSGIRSKDKMEL